jgi:beta-catenin-like protein 1
LKLPKVPQSSLNKRKWSEPSKATLQAAQTQNEAFGEEVEPVPTSLRASKAARVSQEDDEGDEDGEFAPGNDADYFVDEDDDGGRFFGGGLTSQQKRILEIMNSSNGADDERDEAAPKAEEQVKSFRRSLLRLERAINKNQEMRVRFSDDPSK